MKKIFTTIITAMLVLQLGMHSSFAYTCLNQKKNACYRSGYYFLVIKGNSGTQKVKFSLTQSSTTNYSIMISKSIPVNVSSKSMTSNIYGFTCLTSVAYTKLDIENNYTVIMVEGSYVLPAHTKVSSVSYDRCKDDDKPARMNFDTYSRTCDGTSTLYDDGHGDTNRTVYFSMQVNIGQCGLKTVSGYKIYNCTMQFNLSRPTYTIHFNSNGGAGVGDISASCGSSVSLPSTTRDYYNFNGWYSGSTRLDSVYVCNGDVYLTAGYSPVNYSISYDLDGGTASNRSSYNCEQSFYLNNPTKKKYEFIGWTGSNGSTPQKNLKIEYGDHGNKSYTANYIRIYTPPTLNTYDRYVFIGQELYREDLLNHVSSYDEDDEDISDDIILEYIDYGDHKETDFDSVDTSQTGTYTVQFKVTDKNNLTTTKSIHIYVVSDTTSSVKTNYRFINLSFLNTINEKSKWRDTGNYEKLTNSLNKKSPKISYKI